MQYIEDLLNTWSYQEVKVYKVPTLYIGDFGFFWPVLCFYFLIYKIKYDSIISIREKCFLMLCHFIENLETSFGEVFPTTLAYASKFTAIGMKLLLS